MAIDTLSRQNRHTRTFRKPIYAVSTTGKKAMSCPCAAEASGGPLPSRAWTGHPVTAAGPGRAPPRAPCRRGPQANGHEKPAWAARLTYRLTVLLAMPKLRRSAGGYARDHTSGAVLPGCFTWITSAASPSSSSPRGTLCEDGRTAPYIRSSSSATRSLQGDRHAGNPLLVA